MASSLFKHSLDSNLVYNSIDNQDSPKWISDEAGSSDRASFWAKLYIKHVLEQVNGLMAKDYFFLCVFSFSFLFTLFLFAFFCCNLFL